MTTNNMNYVYLCAYRNKAVSSKEYYNGIFYFGFLKLTDEELQEFLKEYESGIFKMHGHLPDIRWDDPKKWDINKLKTYNFKDSFKKHITNCTKEITDPLSENKTDNSVYIEHHKNGHKYFYYLDIRKEKINHDNK